MAMSPEPQPENPIDFRAPPPSPIASGRRSCVNDDVLTEFLEQSLRVPDLILPDKIFPRQKIVETPHVIDLQSLVSGESDALAKVLDSVVRIGCFQLVNYGIPSEFTRLVLAAAAGIFDLAPEKRSEVTKSPENPYGFEEAHGEEEGGDLTEEFVWSRDEKMKSDLEGIWPVGYSNFREKMEALLSDLENAAENILRVLRENSLAKSMDGDNVMQGQDIVGSICCVSKHRSNVPDDQWVSSFGYDVIRMLIKGTDYSHALCLHICDGASEFHAYSKKGWVSFFPDKNAIMVTVGDQLQALSNGKYKHVLGRPIFKGEKKDSFSLAFLYSPPTTFTTPTMRKTLSLGHQAMVAIIFTLIYQILVYVFK